MTALASVSALMTTFNGSQFVATSVASLLAQGHEPLEILIVDDGSTDDTCDLLSKIASADARVRIVSVSHRGIAAARNEALAHATGQFVTFLDQDDICSPGRIARQVSRLSARPGTAAVFGRTIMFTSPILTPADINAACNIEDSVQTMLISAATFRRTIFDEIGKFDPTYDIADDFDFVLRLIESGRHLDIEGCIAVFHRRHCGQRTTDLSGTRKECLRALAHSLRRRRSKGSAGPLQHPLVAASLRVLGGPWT